MARARQRRTVVWDDDAAELVEATVGGDAVDPERLYTVAMAEYLLHSDHEFPVVEGRIERVSTVSHSESSN